MSSAEGRPGWGYLAAGYLLPGAAFAVNSWFLSDKLESFRSIYAVIAIAGVISVVIPMNRASRFMWESPSAAGRRTGLVRFLLWTALGMPAILLNLALFIGSQWVQ